MLFTEGIIEPLKGWVKDFRPPTLQDAIKKTQDMADTTIKKAPLKTFIPQKGPATKFTQQTWTGKDRLDEDTRRELRRKKLCFSCKDPWEPGHRCMGKGKVHYIEVLSDEEDEGEEENPHSPDEGQNSDEATHLEITEHALYHLNQWNYVGRR